MGFFSAGSQKTTTTQKMPKWQEAAVKQNLNDAMASQDIKYTDRNLSADVNPAMYAGLSGLQGINPGMNFGSYLQSGMDSLSDPTQFAPKFDQGAYRDVMQGTDLSKQMAAMDAAYNQRLAGGLKQAGFGAGGFTGNFGSSGALAKGAAIGSSNADYLSSLASLYGGTNQAAINAGLGYGSEAANMRYGAANSLVNNALGGTGLQADIFGQQFGMGGALTDLQQQGIDREVGRDMFNAQAPRDTLAFRQGFAGKMGDYGGTTTQKSPTASPFQQALGAGVSLAGAYMTGGGSLLGGGMGGAGGLFGKWFGGGGGVGNTIPGVRDSYANGFARF